MQCLAPLDSKELQKDLMQVAAGGGMLFLCDPFWGHREHGQLDELLLSEAESPGKEEGWLCIPTGGTSGELRFPRHDQNTISAATAGFLKHFGLKRVQAVGVLPLYHVSGFMSWMRCALSGGQFVDWDWKRLEAGVIPEGTGGDDWVISLVPTQLQRLMECPDVVDWLRRFRAVIVGGAPAWPILLERAAEMRLPISLSYGMTETSAMAVSLRPEEFAAGARCVGHPLPHLQVEITKQGIVCLEGASVFRGYFPKWSPERRYVTEDMAEMDSSGRLRIIGRRDAMIISGGKKIAPAEVEAALLATGMVKEVAVIGVPDPEWGSVVVACGPPASSMNMEDAIAGAMRDGLVYYKCPKRYVVVDPWPRNAQGKVNREALLRSAQKSSD
ncbi:MAG: AMP-binding protein [Opitutaceae bacterium]|jgi:O-succinylbenzoic acid--CoA ligase